MIKRAWLLLAASSVLLFSACTPTEEAIDSESRETSIEERTEDTVQKTKEEELSSQESTTSEEEETTESSENKESVEAQSSEKNEPDDSFDEHRLIEVDGGDLSGDREANVVVDIGFGDREYWSFTNEHGQLVRVVAKEIILQDDENEPVKSNGRYFNDEAKVPGTEASDLDEGHIIADSLGGVSNAHNITPQDSVLNRHGDQAYMERTIRQAGGATNFEAIITYSDTTTQIPSFYKYTYTVNGNEVVDEFANLNPDEYNKQQGLTGGEKESPTPPKESSEPATPSSPVEGDVSTVDANGNGTVTIAEAESAGYSMPITSDHWLYEFMRDNDNDGMVGE